MAGLLIVSGPADRLVDRLFHKLVGCSNLWFVSLDRDSRILSYAVLLETNDEVIII